MAVTGFYAVKFHATLPGMGGIITLSAHGEVFGHDGNYVYSGKYTVDDKKVSATLHVQPVTQGAVSAFNTVSKMFDIKLTGTLQNEVLSLSGLAPFANSEFQVTGKKIAPLAV